jgi:hypothetical protein
MRVRPMWGEGAEDVEDVHLATVRLQVNIFAKTQNLTPKT